MREALYATPPHGYAGRVMYPAHASLILLALLPGAALASPTRVTTREALPEALYVRARAAASIGDLSGSAAGFSTLLDHDPDNLLVVQRAYSQAVIGGDEALALRAAKLLDKQGQLPSGGRMVLAIAAVRTRDWAAARAATAQMEKDRLFALLTPFVNAWIAVGTGTGDPLAILDGARAIPLAQPYVREQRALVLLALGRVEEGVAALRGPGAAALERLPMHTRLVAADALAGARQKERAMGLLAGDEPVLAAARARIGEGKRLPERIAGPAEGIAALMVQLGVDVGAQRANPAAVTFARLATFAAPQDGAGWLLVAQLFGGSRQRAVALDALAHIAPDDPLATLARSLRVALLTEQGDKPAALAEALKATERDGAGPTAWARLGDVYMSLDRHGEAADAYARALDASAAARAPADARWPLLLQRAEALDEGGDWPGARAALQQALALAPDQPLVLNQLGYSEIAHRVDVEQASGLIERASKLRPDDPAITDSLGWSYYLRGAPARAVPLLERAIVGNPGEPTINEHLGDAYWATGRFYEARYAWRAALVTAEDKDRERLSAKIDAGLSQATAAP